MRSIIVLSVLFCAGLSEALQCGFKNVDNDEIRKALKMCIKNNDTLETILETLASNYSSSAENDSDSLESSETKEEPATTMSSKLLQRKRQEKRMKRSKPNKATKSDTKSTDNSNERVSDTRDDMEENNVTTDKSDNDTHGEDDQCIVHCVFQNLKLSDDSGMPDHKKVVDSFLKYSSSREVRDFLQDTADECFQEVDEDDSVNSCSYASKLVICLAKKGESNCEDWPAGSLPF